MLKEDLEPPILRVEALVNNEDFVRLVRDIYCLDVVLWL